MSENWKTPAVKELLKVISECSSTKELGDFMRDICTIAELRAMAERWLVVQLLDQGISYREISKQTGASTTTITRIAHWLKEGEGGYRRALKKRSKK